MTNVKRYVGELFYDDSAGSLVRYSDHTREVTRLQRARARNLVKYLLRSVDYAGEQNAYFRRNSREYSPGSAVRAKFESMAKFWSDRLKIRLRRANRIAAKYLGEVSHG